MHNNSCTNRFAAGLEDLPPGEEQIIQQTVELLEGRLRASHQPGALALRGQHAKTVGLLKAEFRVPALPDELRVGVFKTARAYPAWIRVSNGSEKIQSDTKPDVRAVAIKLLDVPGEKVLEEEKDATTQDFILANSPALFARTAADICEFMQRAAGGRLPGYFFALNPCKWRLRELGNLLRPVLARVNNPLAIAYWSQTPYAFGQRAVKYKLVPWSPKSAYASPKRGSNHLRQAMVEHLADRAAAFDFMVQFQVDPGKQPVEDAARHWKEKQAPFVKVATVTIPSQSFDSPEQDTFAEHLSYNPWHSLPEHRPLGGINRARRAAYLAISKLRHELNGEPRKEPSPEDRR
jgi:hypothetical protein